MSGGQDQPLGAAAGGHATIDGGEQRYDQAVLRARRVGDIHLDPARCAAEPAYQQMWNADAEPMPAVVGSESEQIGKHQDTC